MTHLSADIRLRPTRIGFLVRPSDMTSIRNIMRLNTCLWGGLYNPIIPVINRAIPKNWKEGRFGPKSGKEITKGYISFFEPDVYVEAEHGLLEKSGLGSFRENLALQRQTTSLENFMSSEFGNLHDPRFGQSVFDILRTEYESERRFVLRDEYPAFGALDTDDIFSELCIGVYPEDEKTEYLSQAYNDVYKPKLLKSTPETWLKIFNPHGITPFQVTNKHLQKKRYWHHEPTIYIFDPKSPTDIIDIWNSRIEPNPIIPVPINWAQYLSDHLSNIVKINYRPLKGNPNGVMHHTKLIISPSISKEKNRNIFSLFKSTIPPNSILRSDRTSYWRAPFDSSSGPRHKRMLVTCNESHVRIPIKTEDNFLTEFQSISPDFAERYCGSRSRWANVIKPKSYIFDNHGIATVLPYNTYDRTWPVSGLGGKRINICQEGWVFLQDHKDSEQHLYLTKNEDAFIQWFEKLGISACLSEPGNIAKQMLESLKGFWGLRLISDPDSLNFINSLANKRKRYEKTINTDNGDLENNQSFTQDEYDNKSSSVKSWSAFIKKRLNKKPLSRISLSDYIECNVIRLGIETTCTHCGAKNWHTIDAASYTLVCERCLKDYDFPQTGLRSHNENWKYRVIGPFAVPNYAEGSYGALLTLNCLNQLSIHDKPISFTTAMSLESKGKKCEIDFALWQSIDSDYDTYSDPQLVIGEAKSFGENTITAKDIEKLKLAASMLPNSVLVVSVLKDRFSDKEKSLLVDLVNWTRDTPNSTPKNWLILLTGIELFSIHDLRYSWKEADEPYCNFIDNYHFQSFSTLSDAMINIHLGLPSFYDRFRQ